MTEVIITGTGVPHIEAGRAGPGVLVRSGDTALQFDVGRATALRLAEAGTRVGDLDALFVTHHHSDHLTGLQDLLFARWLEAHDGFVPLPVVASNGLSTDYLRTMLDPWEAEIALRQSHVDRADHPAPDILGFDPPATPAQVWSNTNATVSAVSVHHEPVEPAVAYRVATTEGDVVISGDTRVCDEVASLAEGARVLVHEAFRVDLLRPLFDVAPHLEHISEYHADTVALGAQVKDLGIETLVLTHLIPGPRNDVQKQGFIDDVRAGGYAGPVIVADDLTTVTL